MEVKNGIHPVTPYFLTKTTFGIFWGLPSLSNINIAMKPKLFIVKQI